MKRSFLKPVFFDLPYQEDSAALFGNLLFLKDSVFLDSGSGVYRDRDGRFDFFSAEPLWSFRFDGGGDCWSELRRRFDDQVEGVDVSGVDFPFVGGLLGFVSYDYGVERLGVVRSKPESVVPLAQFGFYDWVVVVDHVLRKSVLVSFGLSSQSREVVDEVVGVLRSSNGFEVDDFKLLSPFVSNLSVGDYESAFVQVKQFLFDGDCYQVNFSQEFKANFEGDPWEAFCRLRSRFPAPFGAFLRCDFGDVLSLSPERFLKVCDGFVESKPIKGTRPRGESAAVDARLQVELQESVKDRAENLMIVDLLRNDLSQHCHSVRADKLFAVESFPSVHHLVSTVCGRLQDGHDVWQLWRDCFPGGSITGAPKKRAVEVIEVLEPHSRGIYCGSVGYFSMNGGVDSSIAIRTLLCASGVVSCCGGGGIVMDSVCESEYQEILDKVGGYLGLLE